jgi:probable F420-dependent oxidoreductase
MKVDGMSFGPTDEVLADARRMAAHGYDRIGVAEAAHDPLLSLAVISQEVPSLELASTIAVAFSRTPMTVAAAANDLQLASGGRFTLGLGSQVQGHIERRFSMPWSHPAARMREFVQALRAIWACWNDGVPLDFRGGFYTHTLMTPVFSPAPNPFGAPRVALAAIGGRMAEIAGEVADGVILHSIATHSYVQAVTLPALARGFAGAGRTGEGFELTYPVFVVTGTDVGSWDRAVRGTKAQLAFYASTPGYRVVLEHHGWEGVGDELRRLARAGEWDAMGALITDDMLDVFAVVAPPDELAARIRQRWAGIADRVTFYTPYDIDPAILQSLVPDLQGIRGRVMGRPPIG